MRKFGRLAAATEAAIDAASVAADLACPHLCPSPLKVDSLHYLPAALVDQLQPYAG